MFTNSDTLAKDQTNSVHNLTFHSRFHFNIAPSPLPLLQKFTSIFKERISFQKFLYSSLLVTLKQNKKNLDNRQNCLVVAHGI